MVTVASKDDSPPGYNESVQASRPRRAPAAPPTPAVSAVDHYVDSQGCIVCFDPAVNRDPVLMAQFIRERAQIPPQLIVHIKGTHQETEWTVHTASSSHEDRGHRTSHSIAITTAAIDAAHTVSRVVSESLHGHDRDNHRDRPHRHHSRRESSRNSQKTHTVIDFDFKIDISRNIAPEPEYFVIADSLAAYRGQTFMELDMNPGGRRGANNAMQAQAKTLEQGEKERIRRGELPWQTRNAGGSLTLEEWCADYIRNSGQIKDFKFTKVIHGWDLNALEAAIRGSITAELYSGKVEINFKTPSGNGIHVRPSTGFSKARSNTFLRGLLNVSLVWPITYYLYEQQWRTCGATYALKQWVHLADSLPGDDVGSYAARVGRPIDPDRLARTPLGISEIQGVREGEWFAQWELTVKNAVNGNLKNKDPLVDPHGGPNSLAAKLDGYPGSSSQLVGTSAGPSTSSSVML